MRYLLQGGESEARVKLLLKLTNIRSEDVIAALDDHLVKGVNDTMAAAFNGIQLSNFTRALAKLNEVAGTVEQIKDLDWAKLKSVK